MRKKANCNDETLKYPVNPGDVVIKEWDWSSGKPVKISERIVRAAAEDAHGKPS